MTIDSYVYIAFILAVVLFYTTCIFPTQWLKIERVTYPLGLNKKILQISDLHVERLRISPNKLRAVIAAEQPDYIFLTGDFTKRREMLPRVAQYFAVFRDSGIATYAVLGNHDHDVPFTEEDRAFFNRYGIHLMRNESRRLSRFALIGIDDAYSGFSDVEQAFRGVDKQLPKIVITHDPNAVLDIDEPFAYLMGGHFHGKQFNVPFLFALKPMGKLPRQGIYKGLHESKFGPYYISKGIGQSRLNLRFLVRSEVTIHYL